MQPQQASHPSSIAAEPPCDGKCDTVGVPNKSAEVLIVFAESLKVKLLLGTLFVAVLFLDAQEGCHGQMKEGRAHRKAATDRY